MIQILFRTTKAPKYACRCCSIKYLLFFFASLTLLFLSFPSQSRAVSLQGEWLLRSVPGEDGVSLVERCSWGAHWVLLTQVLHTPDIFRTSQQPIPSHWGSSHPISWCTTLINPVFEHPTPLQSCPLPLLFCIRTIVFFSYVSFPLFIPHLSCQESIFYLWRESRAKIWEGVMCPVPAGPGAVHTVSSCSWKYLPWSFTIIIFSTETKARGFLAFSYLKLRESQVLYRSYNTSGKKGNNSCVVHRIFWVWCATGHLVLCRF